MSGTAALPLDALFPTKGAITPALQIGRTDAINDITGRVVDGDDLLIIEPRRVGKSSTIGRGGAEQIHHDFGGVVAQADMRLGGVTTPGRLADVLLSSALASGGGKPLTQQQMGRIASRTARFASSPKVRAAAELAGQDNKVGNLQALAELLASGKSGLERLGSLLGALEEDARDQQRPVVVFLDEVQDLGSDRWSTEDGRDTQQLLERLMRQPDRLMTFIFAGSEQGAMTKLFAAGMPLHFEAERYRLPDISSEAWHAGIASRFAADARQISATEIGVILGATGGQPLRTMRACREALRIARRQSMEVVSAAAVADAVEQARAHPSWREAE